MGPVRRSIRGIFRDQPERWSCAFWVWAKQLSHWLWRSGERIRDQPDQRLRIAGWKDRMERCCPDRSARIWGSWGLATA
jgi:hypothetical protein